MKLSALGSGDRGLSVIVNMPVDVNKRHYRLPDEYYLVPVVGATLKYLQCQVQ